MSIDDIEAFVDKIERYQIEKQHDTDTETASWYMRHRGDGEKKYQKMMEVAQVELEDSAACMSNLFGSACGDADADY